MEIDDAVGRALRPATTEVSTSDQRSSVLVSTKAVADTIRKLTPPDDIAIVVHNNMSARGATAGQYVILQESTISGCSDGLYVATQAIPANTVIDSTYLTAVSIGGLNHLSSRVEELDKIEKIGVDASKSVRVNVTGGFRSLMVSTGINDNAYGLWIFCTSSGGTVHLVDIFPSSSAVFNINIPSGTTNQIVVQNGTSGTTASKIDVFIFELTGRVTSQTPLN